MSGKDRPLPRISGRQPGPVASGGASATIAVYSVKGGVGKTTIAANLAWCAATASNRRTLLWDLDAAGGSGFLYGIDEPVTARAEDVFSRERSAETLIRATAYPHLAVLPADESIRALDRNLIKIGKRRRLARLTEDLAGRFDRIILDCPPVMNELSAQVMRAANLVIVPLPPSPLSARAFSLVVREVTGAAKQHPPILPVYSMLDLRRALHRAAREEHADWPAIPYASVVEQCAARQRPVGALAPASPAAKAFAALWDAIERKLADRSD